MEQKSILAGSARLGSLCSIWSCISNNAGDYNKYEYIDFEESSKKVEARLDSTPTGHHALVHPDSRSENLIFFTNHNILHTLKKESLNIMLLHTSRTMDGPWIKMVPVAYRIFDISSSMGTYWKDELGNHTPGTKAQNMHQLRVLGSFWFANGSFSILFKGDPLSCQWQEVEGLLFNPSEPRGRRYVKNMGHNRNRLYSRAIHCPASMEKHYVQWFLLKSV